MVGQVIEAGFNALKEFLGWKKQADDPEVIRLATIRSLTAQIEAKQKEFKIVSTRKVTDANKEEMATALGLLVRDILELRSRRESLKN